MTLIKRPELEPFGVAKLTSVVEKPMGELTEEDECGHEPFESDQEMHATYTSYYGKSVNPNTLVKIVRFELVEKMDKNKPIVENKIYQLYQELYKKHGDPIELWPQWCAKKKNEKLRELITIGAILTQRTSWRNADIALRNLKKNNLLSLKNIAGLPNLNNLTELIRPAGFFQTKPKRLFSFASFAIDNYGDLLKLAKDDLSNTREMLLSVYGIGPETADTILLYALDKPSFIIDEYTKRLVTKRKLSQRTSHDDLKQLFEKSLPKNITIYQNFHALIIMEQKGKKGSIMGII